MNGVFRGLAWIVAVCSVVWLAVLWRWQATGRDVSAPDLMAYLLVLPLVVLALGWALRWAWRGAAARESERAAAAAGVGPAGATTAAPAGHEAERHWAWQLHSAHLNCPCAQDAPALLQAGMKGQPLPALDTELVNAEGLPVLSTRITELALDDVRLALQDLRAGVPASAPPGDTGAARTDDAPDEAAAVPDHIVRALAALAPALKQALDDLTPWATTEAAPTPAPDRWLRVWLGLPATWQPPLRELAAGWAREQITRHWSAAEVIAHVSVQVCDGIELWAHADRLLLAATRHREDMRLLMLGCHSDLSEEAIAALESERRLFDAGQQPRGAIPGEAAAALVLSPPEPSPDLPTAGTRRAPPESTAPASPQPDAPPLAWLHRAALARRDKPIEAAGAVSSQVLADVLRQALQAGAIAADAVAAVICDADAHTPRATELFGTTLKALPHLDPAEQMCRLGTIAAHGSAGALLVVAAAAARVATDGQPCLALSLGDSHWRLALLLRPVPAGPEAGAAAPSLTPTAKAPEARR